MRPVPVSRLPAVIRLLRAARDRDVLRRLELADTDAHLAESREREARHRGDPRPWWERATETEGGYP